ncbi:MAG: F0F1 ATP synthase subunit delta [Prevotella sp.]|jgi:F-type H+-transporting ATPase subunit delta|nr:F0F1 ATP synthase subunit delta [Prevotella sp.]MCR5069784.1 F0F1 ATP synthase subunit delta [Prevotella sp.]
MDIGVISVRYARALLKCSVESKVEDQVYQEMQTLAESYIAVPELRRTIDNPMVGRDKKAEVLKAAAGGNVSEITVRLIDLVLNEGRENMVQFIANSYITLYRQQKNIIRGRLTTAVAVSDAMEQKMRQMVEKRTNGTVEFTTDVDPEILGGFILEYDTYRMDTSVKSQLSNILKQLN